LDRKRDRRSEEYRKGPVLGGKDKSSQRSLVGQLGNEDDSEYRKAKFKLPHFSVIPA
jgi:hypothetical protein